MRTLGLRLEGCSRSPGRLCMCHSDFPMNNERLQPLKNALPNTIFWIQNWCGDLSGCEVLPIGITQFGIKKIVHPIKKYPFIITWVTPNSADREEFHKFLYFNDEIKQYMVPKMEQQEYFDTIAQSLFLACPCGNGFDTYRFWECLQYSTIPIVKENTFFT